MKFRGFIAPILLALILGAVQYAHAEVQPTNQAGKAGSSASASSRSMIQQKLQLVKMMLSTSTSMERASRKDDALAKQQVALALARYASANDALNSDDLGKADELADEALRLIEDLSKVNPDPKQAEDSQRLRYESQLKEFGNTEATYHDMRQRMAPASKAPDPVVAQANRQSARAKLMAGDGRYREAADLLKDAQADVVAALNKMLGAATLTFELKFKSDIEEYDYELARYHSYEELAPIAYVELKPDPGTVKLSERYVQESRVMRDAAREQAAKGDHKAAIGTLLEAIKKMQTALRVVGLVLQE